MKLTPHTFQLPDLIHAVDVLAKNLNGETLIFLGGPALLAAGNPTAIPESIREAHALQVLIDPELSVHKKVAVNAKYRQESEFHQKNGWCIHLEGAWAMATALPGWKMRTISITTPAGNTGRFLSPLDFGYLLTDSEDPADTNRIWELAAAGVLNLKKLEKMVEREILRKIQRNDEPRRKSASTLRLENAIRKIQRIAANQPQSQALAC